MSNKEKSDGMLLVSIDEASSQYQRIYLTQSVSGDPDSIYGYCVNIPLYHDGKLVDGRDIIGLRYKYMISATKGGSFDTDYYIIFAEFREGASEDPIDYLSRVIPLQSKEVEFPDKYPILVCVAQGREKFRKSDVFGAESKDKWLSTFNKPHIIFGSNHSEKFRYLEIPIDFHRLSIVPKNYLDVKSIFKFILELFSLFPTMLKFYSKYTIPSLISVSAVSILTSRNISFSPTELSKLVYVLIRLSDTYNRGFVSYASRLIKFDNRMERKMRAITRALMVDPQTSLTQLKHRIFDISTSAEIAHINFLTEMEHLGAIPDLIYLAYFMFAIKTAETDDFPVVPASVRRFVLDDQFERTVQAVLAEIRRLS